MSYVRNIEMTVLVDNHCDIILGMSSGKTHGRVTQSLALPILLSVTIYSNSMILGIMAMVGCLLGLLLEPDLDVDHKTMSERRISNVSAPLGRIWFFIWLPYAKLLPHRSFFSHAPIFGTAIRYIYIGVWFLWVPLLLGFGDELLRFVQEYQLELAWIFIGTCVSDLAHFVFDQL